MKKLSIFCLLGMLCILPVTLFAAPTVFPTGTTIYDPEKCWNGFTIFSPVEDNRPNGPEALLIDMNGNVVHRWPIYGYPVKLLPGGHVIGGAKKDLMWFMNPLNPITFVIFGYDMVQMNFDGEVVWKFDRFEKVKHGDKTWWTARQHHDFQREGNPVGYYAPGMKPQTDKGKTLILGQKGMGIKNSGVYEVSWDGKILWQWWAQDHIENFLKKVDKKKFHAYTLLGGEKRFSIESINTASYVGPNKWYDEGDERFHPDNIICDNTFGEMIYIISRKTGEIVWWVGPDFSDLPELRHLGFLPGHQPLFTGGMLHHAHVIPKGLPGAGNILVFNNGKPYSTVTEFNPKTKRVAWEYSPVRMGHFPIHGSASMTFFSGAESSAQRLPNGNTLITEADCGRIFEVTPKLETVWEYVNPREWYKFAGVGAYSRTIYRAYRVPYDWVPQLQKPMETAVTPPDNADFEVPNDDETPRSSPY